MSSEELSKEEIEQKAKEMFGPKFEEFAKLYLEGEGPPACYGSGSPYYFCTSCNYSTSC